MRTVKDLAVAWHRACARAGVSYACIGGMAVVAWGQPRTTSDVDVLVTLAPAQVTVLTAALGAEGLRVTAMDFEAAFHDRSHVSVFDAESTWHLDVKLARGPLEEAQVHDAVDVTLPPPPANAHVRVVRPEDTVAFKLKFGSPQDLADARSILARQRGRLDVARMERIAETLGVAAPLRRMQREASAP